ncbi:orotidine-5'-phosphate decarboxylase [Halovulum sp. GXIMD14793]
MTPDDRLIVALDYPNALESMRAVDRIGDAACFYKIGLGMLTGGGLALADQLKSQGLRVFLDMKLFDIANTIRAAVAGLAQYELDFLTVHGDPHVVRAAVAGRGAAPTKIMAVTFLTSVDRNDLDLGLIQPGDIADLVTERARLAFEAGADGVIASAWEAAAIRALVEAKDKLIVTPGIRPEGGTRDDQKRIATPAEAFAAGADHVVVGRPITGAKDPAAAAKAVLASS